MLRKTLVWCYYACAYCLSSTPRTASASPLRPNPCVLPPAFYAVTNKLPKYAWKLRSSVGSSLERSCANCSCETIPNWGNETICLSFGS